MRKFVYNYNHDNNVVSEIALKQKKNQFNIWISSFKLNLQSFGNIIGS